MQIYLQFNGYMEMRNFCQQIIGNPGSKPFTMEELTESAKEMEKLINRTPVKEKAEKVPKKPEKKLKDVLKEEKAEKAQEKQEEKKQRKPRTRITQEKKKEVLRLINSGFTVKETAEATGICGRAVFKIINGK